MDKKIIKNFLVERFLNEAKPTTDTPGITVTNAMRTKSGKENKAGIKDMQDNLKDYDKSVKKQAEGTKEMPQNKFNYNDDNEQTYHQQMEDMNGQEMIEYDRDPNKMFKDRAQKAIEGDSTMGNNPEWANVVPKQQGFTGPEFGKNLVKAIKASFKKRQDAVKGIISFGDDFEVVPDDYAPMSSFSALNENDEIAGRDIEFGKPYGTRDEYEFNNAQNSSKELEYKGYTIRYNYEARTNPHHGGDTRFDYEFFNNDNPDEPTGYGRSIEDCMAEIDDLMNDRLNENNNKKPQIKKESMKRLKFKQEFNGVGNALKMIPESYRVDNKEFEMTDGNESYRIRWEGTLTEGRAIVLTASDKTMINEDMQKMKHLMGYKSQDTLGLVKGNSRIEENATFGKIWDKTKILMEAEDIEGKKGTEKKTDEKVAQAADAKKHVEGSVSTDKGTKAPAAKTGSADSLEKVKSQAPEAKKNVHVGTAGDAKIGMGLGDQSEGEGEWDQMDVKQAAAHGNPSNTTYAPAPKTGEWDKVSVPQAADAKKHVSMNEGVQLGDLVFTPMNVDELFK
jgi:hypothetical protein